MEEFDDLGAFVASGEDEDRRHVFAPADLADDAESVEARKHEVEQEQVVVLVLSQGCSVGAIFDVVDREAAALAQGLRNIICESDFVFDNQHSHT